ncbi:MAG: hypothetical protein ACI857_001528 [Arenicella sp.]|jgi:hypothetical protein
MGWLCCPFFCAQKSLNSLRIMKQYLNLYGPINGLVCLGLGLMLFIFNILLIEIEHTTIRFLILTPIPLILSGISLIIWPGVKLNRKQINDDNISFWFESPKTHKFIWIAIALVWIIFLVFQVLSLFGILEIDISNCFLAKYLGIGSC